MEEEIGGTVNYAGTDYPCLMSDPSMAFDAARGGIVESGEFSVKIRRAILPTPKPAAWATMTVGGVAYKISAINDKPGAAQITYSLER